MWAGRTAEHLLLRRTPSSPSTPRMGKQMYTPQAIVGEAGVRIPMLHAIPPPRLCSPPPHAQRPHGIT